MLLLLLACKAPAPEDTAPWEPSWDQPDWDTPGARRWANTGGWYPNDPDELDAEVQALLEAGGGTPQATQSVLVPHARFLSAGAVAGHAYSRVEIPERVILLVPNHGSGAQLAIWDEGPWLVPGHSLQKDDELTGRLRELLPELENDPVSFSRHPPEMQLPFLQYLNPDVRIAAIAIRDTPSEHFGEGVLDPAFTPQEVDRWGTALSTVLQEFPNTLLLTSTDLTHWEDTETTATQCEALMGYIGTNDVPGLHAYVVTGEISIGGEIPTAIMMSAMGKLGYAEASWSHWGDSFHVNEDPSDVIAYPSLGTWSAQ